MRTNVGDRRERLWMVIATHVLPTRWCAPMGITAQRTRMWAERWWEIEPEMRMALFQSMERAGGQATFDFVRFQRPPAKRKTFEQHMRRGPAE